MSDTTKDLHHFTQIARRGQSGAASGGEQRALALAKAIVEHCYGLDLQVIRGLKEFVEFTNANPSAAAELFE